MSDTQTIAVRTSTDLASLDELEGILRGTLEAPEVMDDPAQIQAEIIEQLLAAESDAELESVGNATGWRDLLGVPVEIHGFRWRPSAFEEGSGPSVFFVVSATRLDTGEQVVLTTGSANVLAQLCNMARRGTLVGAVRMAKAAEKPTKSGFTPYSLVTPAGHETPAEEVEAA